MTVPGARRTRDAEAAATFAGAASATLAPPAPIERVDGSTDPDVAALIVTWNGFDTCVEAIASVDAVSPRPRRILLVDNGSATDLAAALGRACPGIEVMRLLENRGVAEGRNAGLRHLLEDDRLRYILQLDDDATLAPDALSLLRAALETDPRAGIAGPLILDHDAPDRVWGGEGRLVFREVATDRGAGVRPRRTTPYAVDYVSGCCMLIDRAVLELGLLDPRYFMVYQDTDLCMRARRAGWRTLLVPAARVRHRGSVSTGGLYTPGRAYFTARNTVLFTREYGRWSQRLRMWICIAMSLPVAGVREGLRGNLGAVTMKVRGYRDAVTGRSSEPVIARYFQNRTPSRHPVRVGALRGFVAQGEDPARWVQLIQRIERGEGTEVTWHQRSRDRTIYRVEPWGSAAFYVKRYDPRSRLSEAILGRAIGPVSERCWHAADALDACGVTTPRVRAALHTVRGGRTDAEYLVTDAVGGARPLREVLAFGVLPADRRADILAELAALIARLHARGIFHLDIAPTNTFWADDRRFTLIDLDNLIRVEPRHAWRHRVARRFDLVTLLFKFDPFLDASERRTLRTALAAATGSSVPARVPRIIRSSQVVRRLQLVRRLCTAARLVR